jgi:hypothetical protein
MRLTLTSDQFNDTLALAGSQFINEMFRLVREIVEGGGVVIVETQYVNAPAEIRYVFRTPQDLTKWEASIARVTELAHQQKRAKNET